jgi:hypothetical protein
VFPLARSTLFIHFLDLWIATCPSEVQTTTQKIMGTLCKLKFINAATSGLGKIFLERFPRFQLGGLKIFSCV